MKYPEDFINKLICGDCPKVMKTMPDNSIDTIITDPPYGLEFMGQKWDKLSRNLMNPNSKKGIERKEKYGRNYAGRPSNLPDLSKLNKYGYAIQKWHYDWAIEALRVAKPGSTLLCFGGTRTYHRLTCGIEDAGWIIKDCIMWLYGSGFPKATDISKQIDKRAGKKRIAKKRIRIDDKKTGIAGGSFMSDTVNIDYPEAITTEAKLWNGWKSHGLKPAYEPILVAMKPNEGSYANNALKWKVAGLNMDGGKIVYKDNGDFKGGHHNKQLSENVKYKKTCFGSTFGYGLLNSNINKGRFPANVILDEESARLLDEQSGTLRTGGKIKEDILFNNENVVRKNWIAKANMINKYANDTGGASRFFYCAKASKSERNRGCEELYWEKDNSNFGYHQTNEQRWEWLGREEERIYKETGNKISLRARGNIHPTVKSLSLIKYLVKLTLMPNIDQIYLDPFFGSGTTLMACKELKRDYIGIDNNPEYCEIAGRRINTVSEPLF